MPWSGAFEVGVLEEGMSMTVICLLVLALCSSLAMLLCLQDKALFTHWCAGGIWCGFWHLPRAEGISLAPGDASGVPG